MGNSPLNGGLIRNGNQACQVNVRGTSATLFFHGKKVEKSINGKIDEMWNLTYKVGNSTCSFRLSKTVNPKRRHDEDLNIIFSDHFNLSSSRTFMVHLKRDEVGLLHHTHMGLTKSCKVVNWTSFTTNTNSDITETSFDIYGIEGKNRRGITITEWKKKNKYNKPYMGSVTHYFLYLSNGQEVGFSIAIKKIRVLNDGQFDFVVDGPKQHPIHELADMLEQLMAAMRNGNYNPANNLVRQSESENDADNVDDVVPSPHRGHIRNARGLVSSSGVFYGDYVGCAFIDNLIVGLEDMFI